MNSFRSFTLAGVIAAAAASANPLAARDECPALPELCTAPAMVHGQAITLTYLCPASTGEVTGAVSTVHVTITATTTVTAGAEVSGAPVPPKDIPAPAPADSTSTTTVHSTLTQFRTLTVTRKQSSFSIDIGTPGPPQTHSIQTSSPTASSSSIDTPGPPLMHTLTTTSASASSLSIGTPGSPPFQTGPFSAHLSSSSSSSQTDGFTLIPTFAPAPMSSSSLDIPMPCMTCSFNWLMPIVTGISSAAMVTGTQVPSAGPRARNSSSMTGYTFPTLHVRDDEAASVSANASTSANVSHVGGADGVGASVAAVLAGLVVGVWFA